MRDLRSKIRSIIEYAIVTVASDDSGDSQVSQSDGLGKPMNSNVVTPYGLSSNAPVGSSLLKFLIDGSAQNVCSIAFNSPNRFKGLKPWEVAVGNFLKKNKVFFDEDGGITIDIIETGQELSLQTPAGNIKILSDGTVNINNGNFEVLP